MHLDMKSFFSLSFFFRGFSCNFSFFSFPSFCLSHLSAYSYTLTMENITFFFHYIPSEYQHYFYCNWSIYWVTLKVSVWWHKGCLMSFKKSPWIMTVGHILPKWSELSYFCFFILVLKMEDNGQHVHHMHFFKDRNVIQT